MNDSSSSSKQRLPKDWIFLGDFPNEQSINEIKVKQKVSKRKTDALKDGVKHTYRCNKWKRIRCPYQMYVKRNLDIPGTTAKWSLFESGEHNHEMSKGRMSKYDLLIERQNALAPIPSCSGEDYGNFETNSAISPHSYSTISSLQMPIPTGHKAPVSEQDAFLQNLIQQATNMASSSPPELREGLIKSEDTENISLDNLMLPKIDTCKHSDQSSDVSYSVSSPEFNLADGVSIAGLLQIATDSDLTFTFNARRSGEYCFESNKPERKGRMVVFSDHISEIRVGQMMDGEEVSIEMWRKSDWTQFCWAVRGSCLHFLKS